MNISEDTFAYWSRGPGNTESEKADHALTAVQKAVGQDSALSKLKPSVFLQGSYRALTNVRQESDVDICVRYNRSFFAKYPQGKTAADFGNEPSDLSYADFKSHLHRALKAYFPNGIVTPGGKAFDVQANTYRVHADVIPTFESRIYTGRTNTDGTANFLRGVAFKTNSGSVIYNWPEQNYARGVDKNSECRMHYKEVVRILKRLRYDMEDNGATAAANIPSFLVESLTYNVPNDGFLHETFTEDLRSVIIDAYNATTTDANCAGWYEVNGIKPLFGPAQAWSRQQVSDFLVAAWNYAGFQ